MAKFKVRFIHVLFGVAFIAADIFVYLFLGLLLMNYEDFYDPSEGEYWSLASMNTTEKIAYIGIHAWFVLNILGLIYISYRIVKWIDKKLINN